MVSANLGEAISGDPWGITPDDPGFEQYVSQLLMPPEPVQEFPPIALNGGSVGPDVYQAGTSGPLIPSAPIANPFAEPAYGPVNPNPQPPEMPEQRGFGSHLLGSLGDVLSAPWEIAGDIGRLPVISQFVEERAAPAIGQSVEDFLGAFRLGGMPQGMFAQPGQPIISEPIREAAGQFVAENIPTSLGQVALTAPGTVLKGLGAADDLVRGIGVLDDIDVPRFPNAPSAPQNLSQAGLIAATGGLRGAAELPAEEIAALRSTLAAAGLDALPAPNTLKTADMRAMLDSVGFDSTGTPSRVAGRYEGLRAQITPDMATETGRVNNAASIAYERALEMSGDPENARLAARAAAAQQTELERLGVGAQQIAPPEPRPLPAVGEGAPRPPVAEPESEALRLLHDSRVREVGFDASRPREIEIYLNRLDDLARQRGRDDIREMVDEARFALDQGLIGKGTVLSERALQELHNAELAAMRRVGDDLFQAADELTGRPPTSSGAPSSPTAGSVTMYHGTAGPLQGDVLQPGTFLTTSREAAESYANTASRLAGFEGKNLPPNVVEVKLNPGDFVPAPADYVGGTKFPGFNVSNPEGIRIGAAPAARENLRVPGSAYEGVPSGIFPASASTLTPAEFEAASAAQRAWREAVASELSKLDDLELGRLAEARVGPGYATLPDGSFNPAWRESSVARIAEVLAPADTRPVQSIDELMSAAAAKTSSSMSDAVVASAKTPEPLRPQAALGERLGAPGAKGGTSAQFPAMAGGARGSSIPPAKPELSAAENLLEIINVPRSAQAGLDISYAARQLGPMAPGNPRAYASALRDGFAALRDPAVADDIMRGITRDSRWSQLGIDLKLAPLSGGKMGERELAYTSSLVERIPGVGRFYQATQRENAVMMNSFRSRLMDDFVSKWEGRIPLEALQNHARYIERSTGYAGFKFGPLDLEKASGLMSQIMYSARFPLSLVQRLGYLNPMTGGVLLGPTWRAAVKDQAAFIATGVGILTLAEQAGLGKVNWDPRSTDFGKLVSGKSHIDIWGGFQPLVKAVYQAGTGQKFSSTGKLIEAKPGQVIANFLRNKQSPQFQLGGYGAGELIGNRQTGLGFTGKQMAEFVRPEYYRGGVFGTGTFWDQSLGFMAPLFLQDVVDGVKEEGLLGGIKGASSFFGVGAMSYEESDAQLRAAAREQILVTPEVQALLPEGARGLSYAQLTPNEQAVVNELLLLKHPDLADHESEFAKAREARAAVEQQAAQRMDNIWGRLNGNEDPYAVRKDMQSIRAAVNAVKNDPERGLYNQPAYKQAVEEMNKAVASMRAPGGVFSDLLSSRPSTLAGKAVDALGVRQGERPGEALPNAGPLKDVLDLWWDMPKRVTLPDGKPDWDKIEDLRLQLLDHVRQRDEALAQRIEFNTQQRYLSPVEENYLRTTQIYSNYRSQVLDRLAPPEGETKWNSANYAEWIEWLQAHPQEEAAMYIWGYRRDLASEEAANIVRSVVPARNIILR